jgi:hypothetical protein
VRPRSITNRSAPLGSPSVVPEVAEARLAENPGRPRDGDRLVELLACRESGAGPPAGEKAGGVWARTVWARIVRGIYAALKAFGFGAFSESSTFRHRGLFHYPGNPAIC